MRNIQHGQISTTAVDGVTYLGDTFQNQHLSVSSHGAAERRGADRHIPRLFLPEGDAAGEAAK